MVRYLWQNLVGCRNHVYWWIYRNANCMIVVLFCFIYILDLLLSLFSLLCKGYVRDISFATILYISAGQPYRGRFQVWPHGIPVDICAYWLSQLDGLRSSLSWVVCNQHMFERCVAASSYQWKNVLSGGGVWTTSSAWWMAISVQWIYAPYVGMCWWGVITVLCLIC